MLHILVKPPAGESIGLRVWCVAETSPTTAIVRSNEPARSQTVDVRVRFISKRRDTVERLWRVLETAGVVLVCGTPCTGESTLGHLTMEYAEEVTGREAVYFQDWGSPEVWSHGRSTQDILEDACKHISWITDDLLKLPIAEWGVFFVIDEAQTSYLDRELWNDILKACSKTQSPTKFLLLARHGSSSQQNGEHVDTPIVMNPNQQVFLRAPSLPNYPQVSLFLSLVELTEAVRQHELQCNLRYNLGDDAIKELLKVSCGHVGLAKSLLGVVYDQFGTEWDKTELAKRKTIISDSDFIKYTSSTTDLLEKLDNRLVNYSLARNSSQNPLTIRTGVRDLCLQILLQGPVRYNQGDECHNFVYMKGICQGQPERVRVHRATPYEVLDIVDVPTIRVAEDATMMDYVACSGQTVHGANKSEGIEELDCIVLVFPTMIHAR